MEETFVTDSDLGSAFRRRRRARVTGVTLFLAVVAVLAAFSARDDAGVEEPSGNGQARQAGGIACNGPEPPEANPRQYSAPRQVTRPGIDYRAIIETSCGTIEVDLLEEDAPVAVNNFVFLAREGFYDGLTWHRIERNFVIEAGDPSGVIGEDPDGPGYTIPDELPERSRDYRFGVVAMATEAPDSGGSRFFIIVHDRRGERPAGLKIQYSIFGRVEEHTYETLLALHRLPVHGGIDPVRGYMPRPPAYINSIEIDERPR